MKCPFSDNPGCSGSCSSCKYMSVIIPLTIQVDEKMRRRVSIDNIFRSKVKELVDLRKSITRGREGLDVSPDSLYCLLKHMDSKREVLIDFYICDRWKLSSDGLGLTTSEECLSFLPDDLITSHCSVISYTDRVRIRADLGQGLG